MGFLGLGVQGVGIWGSDGATFCHAYPKLHPFVMSGHLTVSGREIKTAPNPQNTTMAVPNPQSEVA